MRTIKYRDVTVRIAEKSFCVDGFTGFLYVNEKIEDTAVVSFIEGIYKMARKDIQNELKKTLGI